MKLKPVIVQDVGTKEVLMLAWANDEALQKTKETGNAWYFSRSRKKLWKKGETSGNIQKVKAIFLDCDKDTLLYLVEQKGTGSCHLNKKTCFENKIFGEKPFTLFDLEKIISQRAKEKPKGSYTVKLLENKKLLKEKILEEAKEVIEAKGKKRTIEEVADLLYFLMVLLGKKGIRLSEIYKELNNRNKSKK